MDERAEVVVADAVAMRVLMAEEAAFDRADILQRIVPDSRMRKIHVLKQLVEIIMTGTAAALVRAQEIRVVRDVLTADLPGIHAILRRCALNLDAIGKRTHLGRILLGNILPVIEHAGNPRQAFIVLIGRNCLLIAHQIRENVGIVLTGADIPALLSGQTRLRKRILRSGDNALAGVGRTAYRFDLCAVSCNDCRGNLFDRTVADSRRLTVGHNCHIGDYAVFHTDVHRYVAVVACTNTGIHRFRIGECAKAQRYDCTQNQSLPFPSFQNMYLPFSAICCMGYYTIIHSFRQ